MWVGLIADSALHFRQVQTTLAHAALQGLLTLQLLHHACTVYSL